MGKLVDSSFWRFLATNNDPKDMYQGLTRINGCIEKYFFAAYKQGRSATW